jgi:hypothetical protein
MSDDEDTEGSSSTSKGRSWTEFDCPGCDANNPTGEGFRAGDEIVCMFCGVLWVVKADEERFRLVEA